MLKFVDVDVVGADAGGCVQSLHSSSAMVICNLKSVAVVVVIPSFIGQMI